MHAPPVLVESAFQREGRRAQRTGERLLPRVLPLVLCQVLLSLEHLLAEVALLFDLVFALLFPVPTRLSPSRRYLVHAPLVLVEAACRREGCRAQRAGERLLARVLPLMLRQVLLGFELLLAVGALGRNLIDLKNYLEKFLANTLIYNTQLKGED